jgi:hypothetical protein
VVSDEITGVDVTVGATTVSDGKAGKSVCTGSGVVLAGTDIQADNTVIISRRTKSSRFILSPDCILIAKGRWKGRKVPTSSALAFGQAPPQNMTYNILIFKWIIHVVLGVERRKTLAQLHNFLYACFTTSRKETV